MGYSKMTHEDLYEIYRRRHDGQSIKRIAATQNRDRKTVRSYLVKLSDMGYTRDIDFPDKEVLHSAIEAMLPKTERSKSAWQELEQHRRYIQELLTDAKEPVKAKTAWHILKAKYDLKGSYETFKRFVRSLGLKRKQTGPTIRIELSPGQETQIDYGKVGLLMDPVTGKDRTTYAFCGRLSYSRLPFIQFVYTQNQKSFVESNVDMLEFYGGATSTISLDNLKAGVIKADLVDPKINRAFQEMAEYYGIFVDSCRIYRPKDKGKVERLVPQARELFRRLKHLYPTQDIHQLNKYALDWCQNEYGAKEHGTTGHPPYELFLAEEKEALKKLPDQRFEAPIWKPAKVHPDQFFSFEKKRYSLPWEFVGQTVFARSSRGIIRIFADYKLIREYVIPKRSYVYEPKDFPEVTREMMNGGFPRYLLKEAEIFGLNAHRLIESVLKPHANLNSRRAQGMLALMKKYHHLPMFADVCSQALNRGINIPKLFKTLLEDEARQQTFDFITPLSEMGAEMVRNIGYYLN